MTSCMRLSRALDNPAVLITCFLRSASSVWCCSSVAAHALLHVLRIWSKACVPIMDTMPFLMLILPWLLFDNAEPQIGSRRRLEDPRSFQFYLLIGSRLEKAKTFPKEDRDNANMDLANQPGS